MNFFESQARVRRNTIRLVCLFAIAVIILIIMTNMFLMVMSNSIYLEQLFSFGALLQNMDWFKFALVSLGVSVVVLMGSASKIMVLSAGGKVVAESLGGQLIAQNTGDPMQRRLLNVVEEMAIASGTPVPPVYILTGEPGINAFAAGFTARDAVIGVTQGVLDHLNREQLQGVIAHEFSHIFNGDMRLNIRLIGVLNGILIIGQVGRLIFRASTNIERGRKNVGGWLTVLGVGLMVIGFAGTFFGGLIKAAVCRQREYLADASAVQFTRNPDGIASALKRIGGLTHGSIVNNPSAPEISHAFFADGVYGFMQSLAATHPPLDERIRRIEPYWDGKFDFVDKIDPLRDLKKTSTKAPITREEMARKAVAVGATMAGVRIAIDQIGNPKQETINYTRDLIAELPKQMRDAARDPYGARAVIFSLLLDLGQAARGKQLQYLKINAEPEVFVLTKKYISGLVGLDIKYRLPLIDMAIPALKQLSITQYNSFREQLTVLLGMDNRIDLLEWSLQKILLNHLDSHFFKPALPKIYYSDIKQLRQEVRVLLSVIAYAGHHDQLEIESAFSAAIKSLEIGELQLPSKTEISFSDLDIALQRLVMLSSPAKLSLLKACAVSVMHDQQVSPEEVELFRAFSDALDCPMPPIIG